MTTSTSQALVAAPASSPSARPPAIAVAPSDAAAWPAWQRFAFRYLAIHWVLYTFPGLLSGLLSLVDRGLRTIAGPDTFVITDRPWKWPGKWNAELGDVEHWWEQLTTWLYAHGLVPVSFEPIHQETGSSDTAHDWTRLSVIVVVSLLLASAWTLLARATRYPRLGRWLHLLVRWNLAFAMLTYGFAKFYVGQFGELSPSRLTQEIGDTAPMTMVGTFIQVSRPYELFGAAGEVLAGLLLFHRRTALLGAFVCIAVMSQVCALNWLYGLPVKLYSTHLLLAAMLLLVPWRRQLWALFVRNRPTQPVDLAVVRSPWLAWPLTIVGTAWVLGALVVTHVDLTEPDEMLVKLREKSALDGVWQVEKMVLDGQEVPATDVTRWRRFAFDRGRVAWAQEASGRRVDFTFELDPAATSVRVKPKGAGGDGETWTCTSGKKVVQVPVPLLLRDEDRRGTVDGERRTLVLEGRLGDKQLELYTVEKVFPLQTGFRLRQELPDRW